MKPSKKIISTIFVGMLIFGIVGQNKPIDNRIDHSYQSSNINRNTIHSKTYNPLKKEKDNIKKIVNIGNYSEIVYPYNLAKSGDILDKFQGKDFVDMSSRNKIRDVKALYQSSKLYSEQRLKSLNSEFLDKKDNKKKHKDELPKLQIENFHKDKQPIDKKVMKK